MIVKLRKIGNSVGVLLSKSIINQCDIKDEVDLEVNGDSIILRPVKTPRDGWEQSFLNAGAEESTAIMPEIVDHSFDNEEWTW